MMSHRWDAAAMVKMPTGCGIIRRFQRQRNQNDGCAFKRTLYESFANR
jgi:hypothetical protein